MGLEKTFHHRRLFVRWFTPFGRSPACAPAALADRPLPVRRLTAHRLLLTAHRAPLTAHRSLLTDTSGIALVMVLGVLSLMVILAVAFSISMRTARMAAGNYAELVRARHLAQVGLVRAMDDICCAMGTNLSHPNAAVYPPWQVMNASSGSNLDTEYDTLLQGSTTNFIPRALLAEARALGNRWLEIWATNAIDVAGSNVPERRLMGRVGYLILNCSGLLDANFAGGAERGYGTNAAEIAVTNLPEIGAATGSDQWLQWRQQDVRYETVEELQGLAGNSTPSNFFIYSYFPAGWWDGATTNYQVNLAGTEGDMPEGSDRWRAITNAFCQAGFSPSEACVLHRNLIDYLDADSVPLNLLSTCVEAVPMINEVVFSSRVDVVVYDESATGKTYAVGGAVYAECWYPFVTDSKVLSFGLNLDALFTGTRDVVPQNISLPAPPGSPLARSWRVITNIAPSNVFVRTNLFAPAITNVATIALDVDWNGQPVDRCPPIVLTNVVQGIAGAGSHSAWTAFECLDPRFNAYVENVNLWRRTNSETLGRTNTWTLACLATNVGGDTNSDMYVANAQLRSVAELGYLVYSSNSPWHTVKLYGPDLHRVLDVFAIGPNDSDTYVTSSRRGLVNPNSKQTNALAAVFVDMPVDEYPGGPSNRLSLAQARIVAAALAAGGPYTNLADIGRGLANLNFAAVGATNEFLRESLLRNAAGLLGARQNVFAIVIEAQAASLGGTYVRYHNMAHQRAVAIVWRDPFSGEFFLRSFLWLND